MIKTKIIHLVDDLGIGGTQKVVLDICSSANLDKYEVSIFTLNNNSDLLKAYTLSPAIKIQAFTYSYSEDFSLLGYFKHLFIPWTISKKARPIIEAVKKEKPDIVHMHTIMRELRIGLMIREATACKLIFTQHLALLKINPFSFSLLKLLLRKVLMHYNLIAVSGVIYKDIITNGFLGKKKQLTVIDNKINLQLFKPKPRENKEVVTVVYIARIGYPKGHAELIEAWSKIDPKLQKRLLLIGPDSLNNKIQQLAAELVKDNSVVFMGKQLLIADILQECDFGVFPSFNEGLPISLLEKMAMELPVIVSDIPELKTIVTDGVDGLHFKCGDTDDLAGKITLLLKNRELRLKLGLMARETISTKYGSLNIALPNELFYEKVLKSE
ncbi:MAG TPA: glycosyltransferase [Bacteroidia bacterium]|jgi:glycosyltransferase involved in cell wall biosynthesis